MKLHEHTQTQSLSPRAHIVPSILFFIFCFSQLTIQLIKDLTYRP
jgi:hypothetical protein